MNCALKLVNEIILYYDARSKKHQILKLFHFKNFSLTSIMLFMLLFLGVIFYYLLCIWFILLTVFLYLPCVYVLSL